MRELTVVEVRLDAEQGSPVLILKEVDGERQLAIWMTAAGASGILQGGERSRGQDGERPHGAATKRTHAPGRRRAGGSRSTSNRAASVRPISCQPPGELRG